VVRLYYGGFAKPLNNLSSCKPRPGG